MSADSYKLEVVSSAAKEIEAIEPRQVRRLVIARISALAVDPRPPQAEKLVGHDRYRVRQGVYRVVYWIDDRTRTVRVVKVGHRRDVYRRT